MPGTAMLFSLDEDFELSQPIAAGVPINPQVVLGNTQVERLVANDDLLLASGGRPSPVGGTAQWTCGEPLTVDPYTGITTSDDRLMWQTFRTSDLQPLCNGELGVGASGVQPLLDDQGGMVFAIGLSLPHTFGLGAPNERTITPDITDAVIVRYAP